MKKMKKQDLLKKVTLGMQNLRNFSAGLLGRDLWQHFQEI